MDRRRDLLDHAGLPRSAHTFAISITVAAARPMSSTQTHSRWRVSSAGRRRRCSAWAAPSQRELRAVGAAADRRSQRSRARRGGSASRAALDHRPDARVEHLAHVAVAVLDLDLDRARAVQRGDLARRARAGAPRSPRAPVVVEVADDEASSTSRSSPLDHVRVDEALAALRRLGRERVLRQAREEVGGELDGFTIFPLAKPGWMLRPSKAIGIAGRRKRLVLDLAGRRAVERVGGRGAELARRRSTCVPRADLLVGGEARRGSAPCGISGCAIRYAAAAMISATPALSSAPRSVVPSVGDDVVADVRSRARASSAGSEHLRRVARQREVARPRSAVHDAA